MATAAPAQDPRTVVKIGTRLWSQEVATADAGEIPKPHDDAYEFSNGRKFVEKDPYGDAQA